MMLFRALSPVSNSPRFTDDYWDDLHGDLHIHQGIAEFFCVVGLIVGGLGPTMVSGNFQGWDLGIAFAAMVVCPLTYQFVVCAFKGFNETYQRWSDYSTMMYAIPWRSQLRVYLIIVGIGVVCVAGRAFYPSDPTGETTKPNKTDHDDAFKSLC